jgi:hypothetical protein
MHNAQLNPMAGFQEIVRLEFWLKPGLKPEQDNLDLFIDNPQTLLIIRMPALYTFFDSSGGFQE